MSNNPWFPLWVGDFISDTAHLSDAETGQYLLILMCLWRNGGELPDDPAKLARIARVSRYRRVSSEVMKFFKRKNGTITQKRLSQEIEKARQFSKSQSEKAKLRWAPKSLENNETADAQAMPSQSHSHSQTSNSVQVDSQQRRRYAYEGKVIRLNAKDFASWEKAYKNLNLEAELLARDVWLASQSDENRKHWFKSTSKYLANRDREARAMCEVAGKPKVSRTEEAIRKMLRRSADGVEGGSGVGDVLRGEARGELPAISSGAGSLHGSSDRALHRKARKAVGANGHARGDTR